MLAAAAAEFGDHGYDRASLRKIAAAAGVTTPVVYDHFGSKAELYAAVAWEQADALLARWVPLGPKPPAEIFGAVIDSIFGWVEEHPHGWRILFADPPSDPVVAEAFTAVQDRAGGVLAEVFASLPRLEHPAGLDRKRANTAFAEGAKAAVNGLATWWWHNPDVPRATVVELATDLIWRGLDSATRTGAEEEGT